MLTCRLVSCEFSTEVSACFTFYEQSENMFGGITFLTHIWKIIDTTNLNTMILALNWKLHISLVDHQHLEGGRVGLCCMCACLTLHYLWSLYRKNNSWGLRVAGDATMNVIRQLPNTTLWSKRHITLLSEAFEYFLHSFKSSVGSCSLQEKQWTITAALSVTAAGKVCIMSQVTYLNVAEGQHRT